MSGNSLPLSRFKVLDLTQARSGPAAVREVNPRIVCGGISGFGQVGPYAGRPGLDQISQGPGGLMSVTGEAGKGSIFLIISC